MDLAAENLLAEGFELLEEGTAVSNLKLDELFFEGNTKSPDFYIQELLLEVGTSYNKIGPDLIFYSNDKGAHLLILNFSESGKKYLIHFSGLEERRDYWWKKTTTRQIRDLSKKELCSAPGGIFGEYLNESLCPVMEINTIEGDAPVLFEVELHPGQICAITLYPFPLI